MTPEQLAAAVTYNLARPYTAATWAKIQRLVGTSPDGKPGQETARKVAAWQAAAGLEEDGQVGPATLAAMKLEPTPDKRDLPALVAAYPHLVFGIDVSSYQGRIDWPAVAGAGVKFAVIKASDWKQIDPTFARNWHEARAARIPCSAYTLAYLVWQGKATDPANHARHFAGLSEDADFAPALDLETAAIERALPILGAKGAAEWIEKWVEAFKVTAGREPMLYLSHRGAKLLGPHRGDLPKLPCWWVYCKSPVGAEPKRAPGWDGWVIRQFTDGGRCPGIAGDVDLDFKRP